MSIKLTIMATGTLWSLNSLGVFFERSPMGNQTSGLRIMSRLL